MSCVLSFSSTRLLAQGFGKAPKAKKSNYRVPEPSKPCLCFSGKPYRECCKPFHDGEKLPEPVQLMRARYAAYARCGHDVRMCATLEVGATCSDITEGVFIKALSFHEVSRSLSRACLRLHLVYNFLSFSLLLIRVPSAMPRYIMESTHSEHEDFGKPGWREELLDFCNNYR